MGRHTAVNRTSLQLSGRRPYKPRGFKTNEQARSAKSKITTMVQAVTPRTLYKEAFIRKGELVNPTLRQARATTRKVAVHMHKGTLPTSKIKTTFTGKRVRIR